MNQSLDDADNIFDDKGTDSKESGAKQNRAQRERSTSQRSQINDVLNMAKEQQKQQELLMKEIERLKLLLVEKDNE